MRTTSIRWSALPLAAVLAAAMTTLGIVMLLQSRASMRDGMAESGAAIELLVAGQLRQSGETVVRVLAENLVNPVYLLDMDRIRELLIPVRSLPDIRVVYVFASDGTILHDGTSEVREFGKPMTDAGAVNAVAARGMLLQDFADVLDVTMPIMLGDQHLGGVRICLAKARVGAEIAAMQARTAAVQDIALDRNLLAVASTMLGLGAIATLFVLAVVRESRARERSRVYERDLARVARLSTMGELASVLAHELNQPLAAIVNFSRGALRRLGRGGMADDELTGALEKVSGEAMRASAIIRHIGDFVRKSEVRTAAADVNAMVRNICGIVQSRARLDDVTLRLDLADGLPQVDANVVEIEQVILNLLLNGIEALRDVPESRREVVVSTRRADTGEVEVEVRDNGCGLPKDSEDKVFEPFFSTKRDGIGMGLRICRTIVESHGGRIWAIPNPIGGTKFAFRLPARPSHVG